MELKINPEYQGMMPPMSQDEYSALKESIKVKGLDYPIDVNKKGEILNGHHRLKICRELGIEPEHRIRDFKDSQQEKRFVIESNIMHRHLNKFQIIEVSQPLLEMEKVEAKKRILLGTPLPFGGRVEGEAIDIVGKKIGISDRTFYRGMRLIEKAPEKLKQSLRDNKISIGGAYGMLKEKDTVKRTPKEKLKATPYGEYRCGKCGDAYWVDCPGKGNAHHFMKQSG